MPVTGDFEAAELALKTLDSERIISPSALQLHGMVAQQRGDRSATLTYYRAAEAALRSGSSHIEMVNMRTGVDEFLWGIQSKIAWLMTQTKK